MSTATPQSGPQTPLPQLDAPAIAVVSTLWNAEVVDHLVAGARDVFARTLKSDANIRYYKVPGAVELTHAAAQIIETGAFNAVVIMGCVIRGGTPHFDYVCQSVTQGMTTLNAESDIPVIFGVLTVDTLQDALDRAGGVLGNKGAEAAEAALRMIDFIDRLGDSIDA